MKYVIRRKTDGRFVSKPKSKESYISELLDARIYNSYESAKNDMCIENEEVVSIDELLF